MALKLTALIADAKGASESIPSDWRALLHRAETHLGRANLLAPHDVHALESEDWTEGVLGEIRENVLATLAVPCPKCGVDYGRHCQAASGFCTRTHRARVKAYRAACVT